MDRANMAKAKRQGLAKMFETMPPDKATELNETVLTGQGREQCCFSYPPQPKNSWQF
jgi:hypothetical protein